MCRFSACKKSNSIPNLWRNLYHANFHEERRCVLNRLGGGGGDKNSDFLSELVTKKDLRRTAAAQTRVVELSLNAGGLSCGW